MEFITRRMHVIGSFFKVMLRKECPLDTSWISYGSAITTESSVSSQRQRMEQIVMRLITDLSTAAWEARKYHRYDPKVLKEITINI